MEDSSKQRQVNELRARQGDTARLVRALEVWADTELLRRGDVAAGVREGLADETIDTTSSKEREIDKVTPKKPAFSRGLGPWGF